MARIMKVRTVPRGYVGMDELGKSIGKGKNPAEWFMRLYEKFGNPQEGGLWSYMLRHNGILLRVTAKDSETVDYDVWVSPSAVLTARRRRTRAVNIIARRLNTRHVAYFPEEGDSLYYSVRQKNDRLMERSSRKAMENALSDEERTAIRGGLSQYMPEVKDEIERTVMEIFDEEVHGQ